MSDANPTSRTASGELKAAWPLGPSIFNHIQANLKPEGGVTEAGKKLPDDADYFRGGMRWAAGAQDGVASHHGSRVDGEPVAREVLALLGPVIRGEATLSGVYAKLKDKRTVQFYERLLALGPREKTLHPERAAELALFVAQHSPDREPVKLALVFLGLFGHQLGDERFRQVVLMLGQHDELTLFAAVALQTAYQAPDAALWQLAKSTTGWGRIQTVERLVKTTDPEIRSWLLREGYRNTVMHEYLAYACAVGGGLADELAAPIVDQHLFDGAGEILTALLAGGRGGAFRGLTSYAKGADAVGSYLRHAATQAKTLGHLSALAKLKDFIAGPSGWPEELRHELAARATEIVERPEWRAQVATALKSPDANAFWEAERAAKVLGLDTWNELFGRVSDGENHWAQLLETKDSARLDRALALAQQKIPLAAIASGPAKELGLGPEFAAHLNLDAVLQALVRYPERGWPFIEAGLASPVVRNRNFALRALDSWPRDKWPAEAEAYLQACLAREPDVEVRGRVEKMLDRDSF